LLVEQALETHKIPYFDGFVGSKNAFFDRMRPGIPSCTLGEQENRGNTWVSSYNYIRRCFN
jgi:hypothetical protein